MTVSNLAQLGKAFAKPLKGALNAVSARYRRLRQQMPGLLHWLIVVGIIGAAGSAGGLVYSSRSSFCGLCHEMQPENITWRASSHAKIACADCHEGAKAWKLVHKVASLKELYLHVTRQVPYHIEIKATVPNETCENCHTKQRQVTASGDLKVPHAKHIDVKGVSCVDCHSAVAHAGIASRFEDLAHNSDETVARAAHMEVKDFRPSMGTCIGCHNQQKATLDCESCHKEIRTPVNHERPEWKFQHGSDGMVGYNECLFCHDITQGKPVVNGTRQISAIRENDTCLACHLKRPPAHDASWVLGHGKVAAGGKAACLVCHDEERKPGSKVEKVVACAQCHNSNHSGNWIKEHPDQVKQAGMGRCFTCHDAKSCSSCHVQRGVGRT